LTFILRDGLILLYICALQVCYDDDDDDDDDTELQRLNRQVTDIHQNYIASRSKAVNYCENNLPTRTGQKTEVKRALFLTL